MLFPLSSGWVFVTVVKHMANNTEQHAISSPHRYTLTHTCGGQSRNNNNSEAEQKVVSQFTKCPVCVELLKLVCRFVYFFVFRIE